MQLDLQKLVGDVRKLTVIAVIVITESLTHKTVKVGTAVALLIGTGIRKGLIDEKCQAFEEFADRYQFAGDRIAHRAGESLQVDPRLHERFEQVRILPGNEFCRRFHGNQSCLILPCQCSCGVEQRKRLARHNLDLDDLAVIGDPDDDVAA